jgi:hypothetical protein
VHGITDRGFQAINEVRYKRRSRGGLFEPEIDSSAKFIGLR